MTASTREMPVNFEWTLRVSRRCRYARLQIKPFGGLEVVIPPRFPRYQVEAFVLQHRDWIEKKLAEQSARLGAVSLPESIELALDNSVTPVSYGVIGNDPVAGSIIVQSDNFESRIRELRQWLRSRAWQLLPAILDELSQRTGIDYHRISIRSQKTRWGSCSSKGTISLNDQLLFVDRQTVEYLVIHELCHRRVMNHSPRFWQLVAHYCPEFRECERKLDSARHTIPTWYMAGLYGER